MLRRTFIHLPGVGEVMERIWWTRGISDWATALEYVRREDHRAVLEESLVAFETGRWWWFDCRIPTSHKWRAWGELGNQAIFVDLETDGGFSPESITVIGTFDGRLYRAFTVDDGLEPAADWIESFPLIVTYNGTMFDLPLLRSRFGHRFRNHIHLDLRYPFAKLGLMGGLKTIERKLGFRRSAETDGLHGWDAVRLWREWQMGSTEAKELLLAYNKEDVTSLRALGDYMYSRMRRRAMGTEQ